MEFQNFDPSLFQFLKQLAKNNNRQWFQENKTRYEKIVLEPALAFIRAFRPRLKKISEYFTAIDRRSGGSLMRVYRDTRFHGSSEPYKTNVGIQFRHEFGRDIHAPGFYVHLEPGTCFLAAGLWRPESSILRQVREAIVENPARWRRISGPIIDVTEIVFVQFRTQNPRVGQSFSWGLFKRTALFKMDRN